MLAALTVDQALDAVAVDVFEKLVHGRVRLPNEALERILRMASRAAHLNRAAGAGDMELGAASWAWQGCLGIAWGEMAHFRLRGFSPQPEFKALSAPRKIGERDG